ncbi:acyl-CoA dehydrogenase family protein [Actinopolyspora mortivallis]|uniref:acyl-CoA dehydrogenase family protein n=1 Tax=Actinopolyspora mortivallis TaxID=33906 RepID=UPI00037E68D2|nr:acyl-CoA dehydrogenase family protein [Actinopolyspora mortivallis]
MNTATQETTVAGRYAEASALDHALGDPGDPENPFGFAAMVARDREAAFPEDFRDRVGSELRLSFVPTEHGGTMTGLDETLFRVRLTARRDLTVMPATMFSVTATSCVLISGSERQRAEALDLLRRGESIGFALSEPEHGSDLLNNECALSRVDERRYRADGHKWLVGLGGRCSALLLVARTGGRGPAAFSAALLRGPSVRAARRAVREHPSGMRGVDFADFRFEDTEVEGTALVGAPGRGTETAMKAMQLVRALSTGANLAASDTALRLTLDFASEHEVAGRGLLEHPHPRREIATAAAAVFAADVVAVTCARGMHTTPGAHSLWSSVAKAVLTDHSEEVFARCANVLGSRSLLTEGRYAPFDVARRDNAVVRFIDTSPVANLRLVAMQLGQLSATTMAELGVDERWLTDPALRTTFELGAELPSLSLDGLRLSVRGRDPVWAALPTVAEACAAAVGPEAAVTGRLEALRTALSELHRDVEALRASEGGEFGNAPELIEMAERYCALHAAASCVHLWWFNRTTALFGAPAGSTGWLGAVLGFLLDRADGGHNRVDRGDARQLGNIVAALHRSGRLFSSVALPLAESREESP